MKFFLKQIIDKEDLVKQREEDLEWFIKIIENLQTAKFRKKSRTIK